MSVRLTYTPYDVERTRKAIAYLESHFKQNISTDQLAMEIPIDKRKLQAVIRILTGFTVHHYLIKIRLDNAINDLNERFELTVEQVALRNGFPSSSWFIKHFRDRMGCTPKEYKYQLLDTGVAL